MNIGGSDGGSEGVCEGGSETQRAAAPPTPSRRQTNRQTIDSARRRHREGPVGACRRPAGRLGGCDGGEEGRVDDDYSKIGTEGTEGTV